jgi:hypothetical protein
MKVVGVFVRFAPLHFNELDSTMLMLLSPVHPSISKMNYVSKIDLSE